MPPRPKTSAARLGHAITIAAACLLLTAAAAALDAFPSVSASAPSPLTQSSQPWAPASLGSIDAGVLKLAITAATCAIRSGIVSDVRTLSVIDYSRPSNEERFWVFDLETHRLLYQELVAHGQGSGELLAKTFSNDPGTHASSLGLFATGGTYVGHNGYSLRLNGLDRGFNDRALERAIVLHGAPYVSPTFVTTRGRLGLSWGCPALREGIVREVNDRLKGSGLLFAYYPDAEWLRLSRYLGSCDSTP